MSDKFDYVKVEIEGCDLGEECYSIEELNDKFFNIIIKNQFANLLDIASDDDVIGSITDFSFMKVLHPHIS